MGVTSYQDRRTLPVYIDAEIDDSGLDVFERAVYLTIARRAGQSSTFYESVANMAERLGIGTTKARETLRALESYGVIRREERTGETSVYVLTDRSEGWRLPPGRGKGATPGVGVGATPRVGVPRRQASGRATPGVAKGTPSKVPPGKVLPTPSPSKEEDETIVLPPGIDREAWDDYVTHRRQKRAALTPLARVRLMARLRTVPPEVANAALRRSVENGWTGVFVDSRTAVAAGAFSTEYRDDVTADDLLGGPLEGRRR